MGEIKACPKGYELVAGECLPLDIEIKRRITHDSSLAIKRVLGYIKENNGKEFDFPLASKEFKRGYDTGHHDAGHKIRHILMESGYYSDEI